MSEIVSRPATETYRKNWDRTFHEEHTGVPKHREDAGPLTWTGCEAALVGVLDCADGVKRAVYERNALVQVFIDQGMEPDDADEWVSVNIEGAYIGKATPLIVEWNWAGPPITRKAD
jgi:hypothetical protein